MTIVLHVWQLVRVKTCSVVLSVGQHDELSKLNTKENSLEEKGKEQRGRKERRKIEKGKGRKRRSLPRSEHRVNCIYQLFKLLTFSHKY